MDKANERLIFAYDYEHNDGDQIWTDSTEYYYNDQEDTLTKVFINGWNGKETVAEDVTIISFYANLYKVFNDVARREAAAIQYSKTNDYGDYIECRSGYEIIHNISDDDFQKFFGIISDSERRSAKDSFMFFNYSFSYKALDGNTIGLISNSYLDGKQYLFKYHFDKNIEDGNLFAVKDFDDANGEAINLSDEEKAPIIEEGREPINEYIVREQAISENMALIESMVYHRGDKLPIEIFEDIEEINNIPSNFEYFNAQNERYKMVAVTLYEDWYWLSDETEDVAYEIQDYGIYYDSEDKTFVKKEMKSNNKTPLSEREAFEYLRRIAYSKILDPIENGIVAFSEEAVTALKNGSMKTKDFEKAFAAKEKGMDR